ncbi:MAG: efflux transporter outer membrane subunit [Acidibrevibacterium sp.]|uniref:efflux transporter outer membrane subunit n=1 Tax=Acidibrevibacterium sp. TaxID=2606776 RepID=UPI003CFC48AC
MRPERRWLAAASLAALLAGCTDFAPKYHAPIVAVPTSFKETGDWQKADPKDTIPRGPWWSIYHDAVLNKLEDQLNAANPDIAAAVAHYDSSRAFVSEINSVLFPSVGTGGAVSQFGWNGTGSRPRGEQLRGFNAPSQYPIAPGVGRNFGTFNQYQYDAVGGSASYEIDLWNQLHDMVKNAEYQSQAAAALLANAQLSLQAQLASDYVLLRGLDAEIDVIARAVKDYQDGVQITVNRYQGQIASGLDISEAKTVLEQAQAEESDVKASRALVEHAIASLVGQPASQFTLKPVVAPIALPSIPTGLPSDLLQRRPDVAAAERQVAAANEEIGVTKAAFFPVFNLGLVGGGLGGGYGQTMIASPLSYWAIGPQFLMPLFEGGYRRAAEAQAYARLREAVANYRATVLLAYQEVEDDLSLLNNLGTEFQQVSEAVNDSARSLQLSTSLFQEGGVNYLDVVVNDIQWLDTQVSAIQVQTRRLQSNVDLVRALGGGWTMQDLPGAEQTIMLDPLKPGTASPKQVGPTQASFYQPAPNAAAAPPASNPPPSGQ